MLVIPRFWTERQNLNKKSSFNNRHCLKIYRSIIFELISLSRSLKSHLIITLLTYINGRKWEIPIYGLEYRHLLLPPTQPLAFVVFQPVQFRSTLIAAGHHFLLYPDHVWQSYLCSVSPLYFRSCVWLCLRVRRFLVQIDHHRLYLCWLTRWFSCI